MSAPPPVPPASAWMLKPMSKITDPSAAQSTFGGLFRGLASGSDKWDRRHVSISITSSSGDGAITYGKSIDKKDKKVKFSSIVAVRSVPKDQMLEAKCPKSSAGRGWVMVTAEGKEVLWAVADADEGEALRDAWVDYLQDIIRLRRGASAPAAGASGAPSGAGGGGAGRRHDSGLDDEDDDEDEDLGASFAGGAPRQTSSNFGAAATSNKSRARFGHDEDDESDDSDGGGGRGGGGHNDDYVDEDGNTGVMRLKTQRELNRLAGGGGGDEDDGYDDDIDQFLKGAAANDDDDDEEDEDYDEDYDDDGRSVGRSAKSKGKKSADGSSAPQQSSAFESKDQLYKRLLIPIAVKNAATAVDYANPAASAASWEMRSYVYLARERMKGYKSHLLSGDSLGKKPTAANDPQHYNAPPLTVAPTHHRLIGGTIRFARFVVKIAKRDNFHERDLVITDRRLYLFAKGNFGRWAARVVDIDQIVGVIESSSDPSIFAVIVPSFHDIFLKVRVGGEGDSSGANTDPDGLSVVAVKRQIIAHLFCAHSRLVTNRNFIFREAENVAAVIRRTEDDQHLPLGTKDDDRLRVASNKDLYPALRTNADTIVYFSAYCERVNHAGELRKRVFVLTDNAMYTVTEKMDDIARRTGLAEVRSAMYSMAELRVLFKGGETDTLVAFRLEEELVRLMELVSFVTLKAAGRQLEFSPHSDLMSHAQLVSSAKLMKFVTPEMSQQRVRRMFRKIGATSASGVGLLGTGVRAVGGLGFHTIKTVTRGVGGVIVDNAIAGEVIGILSTAGNAMSQNTARLIYERLLTVEDEAMATSAPRPYPDRLRLASKDSMVASHSVGEVFFSSRCKTYNLSSTLAADKADQRIACVAANMGLVFFVPHDSSEWTAASLFKRFSSAKGLEIDVKYDFANIKGIITCDAEPTVVGLMTTRHSDVMLRLPNETSALQFVRYLAAAASRYSTSISSDGTDGSDGGGGGGAGGGLGGMLSLVGGGSSTATGRAAAAARMSAISAAADAARKAAASTPFADYVSPLVTRVTCPIYSVPHTAHLKFVLRKTLIDPSPTIACRAGANPASDALLLGSIPQIVEMCRRHGDNAIHFSGMAWRFRKRTARKGDEKMTDKLESAQTADERRHFKSFVLMLTNTAIYDCTKGNYSITRRIPLRRIAKITLSTEDPDALMLHIPFEFDAMIRVEGRRRELMERLQEVYLGGWTDFGWQPPTAATAAAAAAAANSSATTPAAAKNRSARGAGGGGPNATGSGNSGAAAASGGANNPQKFFYPVAYAKDIVRGNNLTTPKDWAARQGAVMPTRVADANRFFYEEDLRRANQMYKSAIYAAATSMRQQQSGQQQQNSGGGGNGGYQRGAIVMATGNGASSAAASQQPVSWAALWANISTAASRLRFSYARAYAYGVRPWMAPAQRPAPDYDDLHDPHSSTANNTNANTNNDASSPMSVQPMALVAQKLIDFYDLSATVLALVRALEGSGEAASAASSSGGGGGADVGRYARLVARVAGSGDVSSSSAVSFSSPSGSGTGRTALVLGRMLHEQGALRARLAAKRRAFEEVTDRLDSGERIGAKREEIAHRIEDAIAAEVSPAEVRMLLLQIDARLQADRMEAYLLAFGGSHSSSSSSSTSSSFMHCGEGRAWTLTERRTLLDACSDLGLFAGPTTRLSRLIMSTASGSGVGGGAKSQQQQQITAGPPLSTTTASATTNALQQQQRGSCELVDVIVESLHYGIATGCAATVAEAIEGAKQHLAEQQQRQQLLIEESGPNGTHRSSSLPPLAPSATGSRHVAVQGTSAASVLTTADIAVIETEIAAAEDERRVLADADALLLDLDHLRASLPPGRLHDLPAAQLRAELAKFETIKTQLSELSSKMATTSTTNTIVGYSSALRTETRTGGAVHASGGAQLRRAGLQIHIDVCSLCIGRIRSVIVAKDEEEALRRQEASEAREHQRGVEQARREAAHRAAVSEAQLIVERHERLEADVSQWASQAESIYKQIQKAVSNGGNNASSSSPAGSPSASASSPYSHSISSNGGSGGVDIELLKSLVRSATLILEKLTTTLRVHPPGYEGEVVEEAPQTEANSSSASSSSSAAAAKEKLRQRVAATAATIAHIRAQLSTATRFADRFIQAAAAAEEAAFNGGAFGKGGGKNAANNQKLKKSSAWGSSSPHSPSSHVVDDNRIDIPPAVQRALDLHDKVALAEAIAKHTRLATLASTALAAQHQYHKQQQQLAEAAEAAGQQQQGSSAVAADGSVSASSPTATSAPTSSQQPLPMADVDTSVRPLNTATLAEVKRQWASGAVHKAWVAGLHRSITAAASVGNAALLGAHLERAEERRYSDDIVEIAKGRHAAMLKAKGKDGVAASPSPSGVWDANALAANAATDGGAKTAAEAEKKAAETAPPSPAPQQQPPPKAPEAPVRYRKPVIIPLDHAYDTQSPIAAEALIAGLLLATVMLLRDCSNQPTAAAAMAPGEAEAADVIAAKTPGAKIIKVPEGTPEVRAVVSQWVSAVEHSVKPSGVFKKVPRTLYDILKTLGEAELPGGGKGSLAAPYTNRLIADFDRIKGLNNPNGASPSYFLMAYILHRGCLVPLVSELLFSVGPKSRADLYPESALMRSDKCFKDIVSIAYMCEQIEWGFSFTETSAVALQQRRAAMANSQSQSQNQQNQNQQQQQQMGASTLGSQQQQQQQAGSSSVFTSELSFLDTPNASPLGKKAGGDGNPSFASAAASPHSASNMSMSAASPSASAAGSPSAVDDNETPLRTAVPTVARGLRQAVRMFGDYYYEALEDLKKSKKARVLAEAAAAAKAANGGGGPAPAPTAADFRPTAAEVAALLDERRSKGVALIVRDTLCPALAAALSVGYRSRSFMSKRYLWEFIAAAGQRLKASVRDLQAVAVPEGIELIMNITDPDGRNKIFMNRLNDEQIAGLRFRMFVCHLLNTNALAAFLTAVFTDDAANAVQMAVFQNPANATTMQAAQQLVEREIREAEAAGGGGQKKKPLTLAEATAKSITTALLGGTLVTYKQVSSAVDATGVLGASALDARLFSNSASAASFNAALSPMSPNGGGSVTVQQTPATLPPLKETPASLVLSIAPRTEREQLQMLHKYYRLDRCLMLAMDDSRRELMRLAGVLSKLQFSLVIDAEVW